MKYLAAYIPGLHEGYLKWFKRHSDAAGLYVFGCELISGFDYLRKDIRALDPEMVRQAIKSWDIFPEVRILGQETIPLLCEANVIVMPDEFESEKVARDHFPYHVKHGSINFESVFLRWDMKKSQAEHAVEADRKISLSDFDREFMTQAVNQSENSVDWWRQIGAMAVKDGEVLFTTFNRPATSKHFLHLFGDPRSNFKRGVSVELSLFLHAEAGIIAEAARVGCSLEGASLYVTTFPCPPCAKLVAYSGIKKLYFKEGYSRLDGEEVLQYHKIEIVRVQ